jgi:capsular exopolysaccharide synthesis family protein
MELHEAYEYFFKGWLRSDESMSRVFEALTKASATKQLQAEWLLEKAESAFAAETAVEGEKPRLDPNVFRANAAASRTNGTVHKSSESHEEIRNGERSWREKIEEWVFGWSLQGYNSYPIVALEKESLASEQYKILREQIKRLRTESGIRNFSITSPVKRDGKTTVAVNLAAALSLDYEEKVLLIDGDLRAPSVHRYFNVPESPGLVDYLASSAKLNLKNIVQETFVPGLHILPAGKPSYLASELLAKERMKQVLEEAQAEFPGHHIIIDGPPILSTPDPLVIARHVDGVLLVVRAGKTPRDYLTKALQSLNSKKIMGVVLNGANLGISSKYYYYSTNGS